MSECPDDIGYTPNTEQVRNAYGAHIADCNYVSKDSLNEFDRWMAQVRAEAKAEGMREAIESVRWVYDLQCPVDQAGRYIHRAARIAHKWWEKALGGRLDELERRANQYKEAK